MRAGSRRRSVLRFILGLVFAATAVGCSNSNNPNIPSSLTGNWTGSVTLVVVGGGSFTGSLQLTLTQSGSSITGTATETFAGNGSSNNSAQAVTWTLNGTALTGTLTTGACVNNISASISGSTISGS